MHRHHPRTEAAAEAIDQLRRQGDLRHQHQSLTACCECGGNDAQVHLGLTAAGYTVEQMRGKGRQGREYGGDAANLRVGENHLAGTRLHHREVRHNALGPDPPPRCQRAQLRGLERCTDLIGGGAPPFLKPGEQGSLLRSAPGARSRQLLSSCVAQGPPFGPLQCRLTGTQADRQCCGKHFAQWVVVVLGRPAQQVEGDRVDDGLLVQEVDCRLQLCGGDRGLCSNPDQNADQLLAPKGHTHPHAEAGSCV